MLIFFLQVSATDQCRIHLSMNSHTTLPDFIIQNFSTCSLIEFLNLKKIQYKTLHFKHLKLKKKNDFI